MNYFEPYKAQIADLCRRYNVRRLFTFGSVLTDRFNDESDIDLIADFDFKYSLEDVFGRKVDLLKEQPIRNSYLRKNIEKTKTLIYK